MPKTASPVAWFVVLMAAQVKNLSPDLLLKRLQADKGQVALHGGAFWVLRFPGRPDLDAWKEAGVPVPQDQIFSSRAIGVVKLLEPPKPVKKAGRPKGPTPEAQRLARIAEILEAVDQRVVESQGNLNNLEALTGPELASLYTLAGASGPRSPKAEPVSGGTAAL